MLLVFFFNDTATTEIYTLSLHDALPICSRSWGYLFSRLLSTDSTPCSSIFACQPFTFRPTPCDSRPERSLERHLARSEEHTSELQSRQYLVCRLLLEKKKTTS